MNRIAIGLTTLVLVALTQLAAASPPHTGIEGRAYHYFSFGTPGTPVEVEPGVWVWIGVGGIQLPIATEFIVLSAKNQREVAHVITDADGFYSVSLPPGHYTLIPAMVMVNPFLDIVVGTEPLDVVVTPRQFTLQNIFYFSEFPSVASLE